MYNSTYVQAGYQPPYRITVLPGFAYWSFLVEERRLGVWLVKGHVPIPASFTDQDMQRALDNAVDEYLDQLASEVS